MFLLNFLLKKLIKTALLLPCLNGISFKISNTNKFKKFFCNCELKLQSANTKNSFSFLYLDVAIPKLRANLHSFFDEIFLCRRNEDFRFGRPRLFLRLCRVRLHDREQPLHADAHADARNVPMLQVEHANLKIKKNCFYENLILVTG